MKVPDGIAMRIRRFVVVRTAWALLTGLGLALALSGWVVLLSMAIDQIVLLPRVLRVVCAGLAGLPPLVWLIAASVWLIRRRSDARNLRRLDNRDDDLRAALNLVPRLNQGDPSLSPDLVGETAQRARVFDEMPLPPLVSERRRAAQVLALATLALLGLAAWRWLSPDMHTGLSRLLHPTQDFGSIGTRKFPAVAEVWANVPVVPPGGKEEATTPVRLAEVYFLRDRLENGGWRSNETGAGRTWADRLAGYSPLAVVHREVDLLEGDRLDIRFQAMDRRRPASLDGVEIVRFEDTRGVVLRHAAVEQTGQISLSHVERDHTFMIRSGRQFSPRYRVHVIPRPTPNRVYLFQRPPAQYGKNEREIVIRDPQKNINLSRMSGLPGSRMAVEFDTPYGDDLDTQASYVQVGDSRRVKPQRLTSRNAERRARGEKLWSFDFTLDELTAGDLKIYFHLVTAKARFRDQPIVNAYDEPILVQVIEDLPPMVEITQLPQRRHFAGDDAFAFRYHFSDDYGVAEVGLEVRAFPQHTESTYVPVGIRPPDVAGDVRKEDEGLQIIDLSQFSYGFVDFAVVVKDVKGQVSKTGIISLTMSDNATETLLPKLTGGWTYRWDPTRPETGQFCPGDLETPRMVREFAAFRTGLTQLMEFQGGAALTTNQLATLAADLGYQPEPFTVNRNFPYAYLFRNYPYYFNRQASAWLAGLASVNGVRSLAEVRALLAKLAVSPDPLKAPEYKELQGYRDAASALFQGTALLAETQREIRRRVALQRAAYFAGLVSRRLAETTRLLDGLQKTAGTMPVARQRGDLWEVYPAWAIGRHTDPEIQQQARLVEYNIRNVNRKLAMLNDELTRIQTEYADGMDPRLMAVVSMVAAAGKSVFNVDRQQLADKTVLLERFIHQGMLGSENWVYRGIAGEFPSCVERAESGLRQMDTAADFAARLNDLLAAAADVSGAGLRQKMGAPLVPAGKSERWAANLASRMRTHLDDLNGQADRMVRGTEFAACTNLVAMRAQLMEFHETLGSVQDGLTNWPALKNDQPVLVVADSAATNLISAVDSMSEIRSDIAILSGFESMFAGDGLSEVTNRAWGAETAQRLAEIGTFDDLPVTSRKALEGVRKAREALAESPWLKLTCGGPDGKPQDVAGGEVRVAVTDGRLAVHARVFDRPASAQQPLWTNTAVEIYASYPGTSAPIRQVIFRPTSSNGPGTTEWYETATPLGTPTLDWHVRSLPAGGYELFALVPLEMLKVDPASGAFLFECAVLSAPGKGAPQFLTLFESGTSSACLHNDRYGRLNPSSGFMGLAPSKMANVKPSKPDPTLVLVKDALTSWWAHPPALSNGVAATTNATTHVVAWLLPVERTAPCRVQAARMPRLRELFTDAATRFRYLAALPGWGSATNRVPATQPQVGISAASSKLFDLMAPAAVLSRLEADIQKAGANPAKVDALFETASDYFFNLPLVKTKDSLANPVEEYVQARIATAFYLCSTSTVAPLVETYTRSGNERKDWLRDYFKDRPFPPEVKDLIDKTDYGMPTLPPDLAAAVQPWLDAGRAGTLDATLRTQRSQRLAELLAVARNAQALQNQQEALVRIHSLRQRVTDLRETAGLMRYPVDDIRNDTPWADAVEEAEGLERDLLAGRLPDIPEPVRQALRQRIPIFRCDSYADVVGDETNARLLHEYEDQLRDMETRLMPRALEAAQTFRADWPNLRRDVGMMILSHFGRQYWLERQLEAEATQKRALLVGKPDKERLLAMLPAGSLALATEAQNVLTVAAFTFRSMCNLQVMEYAADPTDARQEPLLHNYALLAAMKLLAESFYDHFPGALEFRNRTGKTALDTMTDLMIERLRKDRTVEAQVVRFLFTNAPPAGLPSRDAATLDMMMPFEALSVLFQNERVFQEYSKAYRRVVQDKDAEQVRAAVAVIRKAGSSQGQFWRLFGDRLMDAVDAGLPLLDPEAASKVPPAELKLRLEQQGKAVKAALRYVELLGGGLDEKKRMEMAAVDDMQQFDESSLVLLSRKEPVAGEVLGGYRSVHEGLVSYIQSLQGEMFPAEPVYPVRPKWARQKTTVVSHLDQFGLGADMLNTENQWFAYSDRARAEVFRSLCEFAEGKLAGSPPSPVNIAFGFYRFMDARYRNAMPFASLEAGSTRPALRPQRADTSMPEHIGQAFGNAQTIDLPDQDNRLIRRLYFEALQDERDNTRDE